MASLCAFGILIYKLVMSHNAFIIIFVFGLPYMIGQIYNIYPKFGLLPVYAYIYSLNYRYTLIHSQVLVSTWSYIFMSHTDCVIYSTVNLGMSC